MVKGSNLNLWLLLSVAVLSTVLASVDVKARTLSGNYDSQTIEGNEGEDIMIEDVVVTGYLRVITHGGNIIIDADGQINGCGAYGAYSIASGTNGEDGEDGHTIILEAYRGNNCTGGSIYNSGGIAAWGGHGGWGADGDDNHPSGSKGGDGGDGGSITLIADDYIMAGGIGVTGGAGAGGGSGMHESSQNSAGYGGTGGNNGNGGTITITGRSINLGVGVLHAEAGKDIYELWSEGEGGVGGGGGCGNVPKHGGAGGFGGLGGHITISGQVLYLDGGGVDVTVNGGKGGSAGTTGHNTQNFDCAPASKPGGDGGDAGSIIIYYHGEGSYGSNFMATAIGGSGGQGSDCGGDAGPVGNGGLAGMHGEITIIADGVGRYGDFNNDGEVDATDFDTFSACFNGPTNPVYGECCKVDYNHDNYVDANDFNAFSMMYNGPARLDLRDAELVATGGDGGDAGCGISKGTGAPGGVGGSIEVVLDHPKASANIDGLQANICGGFGGTHAPPACWWDRVDIEDMMAYPEVWIAPPGSAGSATFLPTNGHYYGTPTIDSCWSYHWSAYYYW